MTEEEWAEFHRRVGEVFCNALCVAGRLGHRRIELTLSTYADPGDDVVGQLVVDAFTCDDAAGLVLRSPVLQEHSRRMVAQVVAAVL